MIPRNIIVTAKERPEAWLAQLARDNPEHSICFFDDQFAMGLVAKHFPGDSLVAYQKVRPGAYRADLFRYCALQVLGGIYTDTQIPYSLPFSEMWDLDQDRVYLVSDKRSRAIQVGIMACNQNSRFMQLCQQQATRNILANYYGESPFSITGPEMAWRCFRDYTGEPVPGLGGTYAALETGEPPVEIGYQIERTSGAYWADVAEAVVVNTDKKVLFPYKLNQFRRHRKDKDYYWKAWNRRSVYGEKMGLLGRLLSRFGHPNNQ
ncbi:glycosyltransferase [Pseudomonadota bacterium]